MGISTDRIVSRKRTSIQAAAIAALWLSLAATVEVLNWRARS